MGVIGAVLTAVWLLLFALLTRPWTTNDAEVLGVMAIVAAVVIVLELAWPRIRQ